MQSAFIINDRTGKPYAVVGILAGGTEFYPIAESAVSWASWMTADFAAKKISKQELSVTLDNSMSLEGPMPVNRANKPKLDELIKKAKNVKKVESDKDSTEEKVLLPVISLIDARLDNLENEDWRNAVNFKAKSFIADANKSTFAYEVKRTRAVWDPSLAIPGTDRRGGFRCPPGTRYGGQITDRFGRNCGWGVARRLANEIADLGSRVENIDDRRRERRVNRRNERVARRMRDGGRVERAARAIGNALDSGTPGDSKPGLLERAAGRLAEALDTGSPTPPKRRGRQRRGPNRERRENIIERGARRLGEFLDSDQREDTPTPAPRRPRPAAPQSRPARPRQPRRNNEWNNLDILDMDDDQLINAWHDQKPYMPENNRIGMNPMIEEEKRKKRRAIEAEMARRNIPIPAERGDGAGPAPRRPRPNAPAQPRRPRQPRPDNVSGTPVPAGAPRPNETLEEYKRRKYNEHQARVRKIREQGGNAGFLRYDEWEQFHGPAVEDNWNRAQQRNGGRGRRRAATDAGAASAAGRRPSPADQPDAVQPARRQRRPFNAPGQRGLGSLDAAKRKRYLMERDGEDGPLQIVKHNGKYYVVKKSEVDRANANGANLDVYNEPPRPARPPRPPARPATPPARPPAPPSPPTPPSPAAPPAGSPPRPQIPVGGNADDFVTPDLKPRRFGKLLGRRELKRKEKAIDHLHNKNGKLADVPDGIVVDAVIDDDIFVGTGARKRQLNRDELLSKGFTIGGNLRLGDTFENKRYKFELTKSSSNGQKIWEVVKVEDKQTGEIWYLKTSQYGQNDGVLENIGMKAAEVLEFGNEENHLRLNDKQAAGNGAKPIRWIMMRDVNQWNHGNVRLRNKFVDAGRFQGDRTKVEPRDVARLAIMDFVFDNRDRHGGNFMAAEDENGRVRVAVIDNGLLGLGRLHEGQFRREATPAEIEAEARKIAAEGVRTYAGRFNNGIQGLQQFGYRHTNMRNREIFAEQAKRTAQKLRDELDNILSIDRIEANGTKLTPQEKAHINGLRIIAEARLEMLLNGDAVDQIVQKLN